VLPNLLEDDILRRSPFYPMITLIYILKIFNKNTYVMMIVTLMVKPGVHPWWKKIDWSEYRCKEAIDESQTTHLNGR